MLLAGSPSATLFRTTIKARVQAGRLVVDEPTDLPEGTELELLARPLDPHAHRRDLSASGQKTAMGFTGEPVPFGMGNGATVNMNSHRFLAAAASLKASKSARSMR